MKLVRLALTALAIAMSAAPLQAAERVKFEPAAFEAAKAKGARILVEVHAPWCPTCKAQAPIIASLEQKAENKDLLILTVDFDSQKEALRSLNVRQQSTLIAFRGATETSRSVGETNASAIATLVASNIAK